jgi:hypothetical protein
MQPTLPSSGITTLTLAPVRKPSPTPPIVPAAHIPYLFQNCFMVTASCSLRAAPLGGELCAALRSKRNRRKYQAKLYGFGLVCDSRISIHSQTVNDCCPC